MASTPEIVTVHDENGHETVCYQHNAENTLGIYQSIWAVPGPPGNSMRWCYLVVQTPEINSECYRIEMCLEEDPSGSYWRIVSGELYYRKWGFDPAHGEERMRKISVRDLTDAELTFWLHAIEVWD